MRTTERSTLRDRLAAIACVAGTGFLTAPALAAPLDREQVAKLMADTEIATQSGNGMPMRLTFRRDGLVDGVIDQARNAYDSGKWWVTDAGLLCWHMDHFFRGNRICNSVEPKGDELVRRRPDGNDGPGHPWRIREKGPYAQAVIASAATGAGNGVAPGRAVEPPRIAAPVASTPPTPPASVVAQPTPAPAPAIPPEILAELQRLKTLEQQNLQFKQRIAELEKGATAPKPAAVVAPKKAEPPPVPPDLHFGKYHALIVGNNDYKKFPKLKTAINDAKDVAALLHDVYGFETQTILDATRADILTALAKLRLKLTADDNLLVYYAGHGTMDAVAQQGYWLPVDAETDIQTNWVSNDDLTTMLRAIRATHVMIVADSCFSGTLVRSGGLSFKAQVARDVWIKRMLELRARTALVSGGMEPVSDEGEKGHSVFANAFMAALSKNTGILEGSELFEAIKRPVVLNADQTPQYSDIRRAGHAGGDFLFVRRSGPTGAAR